MTVGPQVPVRVHAEVPERGLNVNADFPAGEVTAVLGPNGAGKTTLLHLVAGLVRPGAGTVSIGHRDVTAPGRFVPPHRRHAALLTQDAALFPHLDVLANVSFGPRAAGVRLPDARRRAFAELAALGCAELASRLPHELSGGQAQRVAIARALATDPQVILLDEPLAGLDVAAAAQVRHGLAERLRGRTVLLVTHELLDVWTIADRVVVVEAGEVTASGTAADLLARPTGAFLARLGDTNLLIGTTLADGRLSLGPGVELRGLPDPAQPPRPGEPGLASVSPAAVSVHLVEPGGSPRNVLPAEVSGLEPRGPVVRVHLLLAGQRCAADVTGPSVAELALRPGRAVRVAIKATQVRLYGR